MTELHVCEGNCHLILDEHRGIVRQYRVGYGYHDWGLFWYCDRAVEIDMSKGMTVVSVEDEANA